MWWYRKKLFINLQCLRKRISQIKIILFTWYNKHHQNYHRLVPTILPCTSVNAVTGVDTGCALWLMLMVFAFILAIAAFLENKNKIPQ